MSSILCSNAAAAGAGVTLTALFFNSATFYTISKFTQKPLTVTEALGYGTYSLRISSIFFNGLSAMNAGDLLMLLSHVGVLSLLLPFQVCMISLNGRSILSSCAMVATATAAASAVLPIVEQSLLSYC